MARRRLVPESIGFAIYFGPILCSHFAPRVAQSNAFFAYEFSVFVFLVALVGTLVVSLIVVLTREPAPSPRASWLLRRSAIGFGVFAIIVLLFVLAGRGLPAGSYLQSFDSVAWRNPHAEDYVNGDITIRQRMLGDVVRHVIPGMTRKEIEARLGPSLDVDYFKGTGRDLIYVTGPQRGFFSIDSEWLLIWLDEQDRFKRFEIASD